MKICIYCNKEFLEKTPLMKYCSLECLKRYQHKKEMDRRRTDPVYRAKRNKREMIRRQLKRNTDSVFKKKHNDEEKKRYRKKNGINSDDDLKVALKGSGTINKNGYRQIIGKDHPNAWRNGGMLEHIFIMSEFLKRPLQKHENVHHKNGIRHDNRIENLELWSRSQPPGQRIEDKILWCKEFLDIYGYDVIKRS